MNLFCQPPTELEGFQEDLDGSNDKTDTARIDTAHLRALHNLQSLFSFIIPGYSCLYSEVSFIRGVDTCSVCQHGTASLFTARL